MGIYLGEDKLLRKLIEGNIFMTLDGLSLLKQDLKNINHKEKKKIEFGYVKIKEQMDIGIFKWVKNFPVKDMDF